jgi:DNA-binding MarR family transcriptional regulator
MSKAPKLASSDVGCNATALRKASRRLTQLYDSALEPSGLRSTQFAILMELNNWSASPPTLAELAAALVMERSALGHTLRPLERDGLIALQPGEDRRQRYVVMTAKGKAKCKDGIRLWQTAQRRFEEVFGRSEAAALRATLLGIACQERLASLKD